MGLRGACGDEIVGEPDLCPSGAGSLPLIPRLARGSILSRSRLKSQSTMVDAFHRRMLARPRIYPRRNSFSELGTAGMAYGRSLW